MSVTRKNTIYKNIIYMGIGTFLGQLINVLSQPILTRIVAPEVLGVYTYIISLATIIIPVASLKIDMLIISEKDDEKAQYLTDISLDFIILISILYTIIITIFYNMNSINIFNKYGLIIFIVPIIVLINGIRFLFVSYLNRYKEYILISKVNIIREFFRAGIQVLMGLITGGPLGQCIGYAISPIFGLNIQMTKYLKKRKQRKKINLKEKIRILGNEGKQQIVYIVPAQFINSLSTSLITISITTLYSTEILGYYSVGVNILVIPLIFITSNISKVAYQTISECVIQKKSILKEISRVFLGIIVVSIFGFGILYIIAPQLSSLIFGDKYYVAGEYIRCLCVMYSFRLVASSFSGIYTIFCQQRREFYLNLMLVLVAIVAYVLSKIKTLDIYGYLKIINCGYTIVYSIVLIGYIILCLNFDEKIKNKK